MNAWLDHSPFLAVGIYISGDSRACRSQPNLTPTWVSTQLAARLAAAADHARPAGLVPAAVPALRRRRDDQPEPRHDRHATARPASRAAPRPTRPSPPPRRWASSPAARSGTTSRASTTGNTDCRESALAFLSAWTNQIHALGYVSGVYSSAGSGIKVARRRPGQPARRVRPARPDLDRPLGRRGQHLHVVHPRGRLAPARPDQAVPGRPRRDLGRRHDQHRPQLPRPRPRLGRRARRRTAAACGSASATTRGCEPATATADARPGAGQGAAVPAHRSRGCTPARSTASTPSATIAAANAWQTAHGFAPRRAFGPHALDVRCCPPATRPVLKSAPPGRRVRRVQRALNAAGADHPARRHRRLQRRDRHRAAAWQARQGLPATGIMAASSWSALQAGRR